MSSQRTRTRKPGDDAPAAPTGKAAPAAPAGAVLERGAVQAVRRTDSADRLAKLEAAEPTLDGPIDLSGLEDLARMDRSELDALMNAQPLTRRLKEGQKIKASITRITKDTLLLDVGLKTEATLDRSEAPDAKVGDTIEAFVVFSDGVEAHLSKKLSGDSAASFLDEAMASDIPVEGKVTARNSGGFVVEIGSVRAFCPISHIDRHAFGDMDRFVGQTLAFLVLETGDDKTVVSRKALQQRELADDVDGRWLSVAEGDTFQGVVTSVQAFGLFVDCDGLEGLVPRSEATWDRSADLESSFARGQAVEVRVLNVDRDARKLTYSIKDPGASPWSRVGSDFVAGDTYAGTVERLEDYGAFIRLAPGITGLLHRSAMQGSPPERGAEINVEIRSVDHERKRLELAVPGAGATVQSSERRAPAGPASRSAGDAGGFGTLGDLLSSWKK